MLDSETSKKLNKGIFYTLSSVILAIVINIVTSFQEVLTFLIILTFISGTALLIVGLYLREYHKPAKDEVNKYSPIRIEELDKAKFLDISYPHQISNYAVKTTPNSICPFTDSKNQTSGIIISVEFGPFYRSLGKTNYIIAVVNKNLNINSPIVSKRNDLYRGLQNSCFSEKLGYWGVGSISNRFCGGKGLVVHYNTDELSSTFSTAQQPKEFIIFVKDIINKNEIELCTSLISCEIISDNDIVLLGGNYINIDKRYTPFLSFIDEKGNNSIIRLQIQNEKEFTYQHAILTKASQINKNEIFLAGACSDYNDIRNFPKGILFHDFGWIVKYNIKEHSFSKLRILNQPIFDFTVDPNGNGYLLTVIGGGNWYSYKIIKINLSNNNRIAEKLIRHSEEGGMKFPEENNISIHSVKNDIIVGGGDARGDGDCRLVILNEDLGIEEDQLKGRERIHESIIDICYDGQNSIYLLLSMNVAYSDNPFIRIIKSKYLLQKL